METMVDNIGKTDEKTNPKKKKAQEAFSNEANPLLQKKLL